MCWMESIHVFTKKSFGVLRDFLITIALSHDYSLQISQCDSSMGCVTDFDFHLPCVLNHDDVFC